MKKYIPNILTVFRLFSAFLLLLFPTHSAKFLFLYFLCGISDIADGAFARKFNSESKVGAKLDSCADFVFSVTAAAKFIPVMNLPLWFFAIISCLAAFKIFSFTLLRIKSGFSALHSVSNRLVGLLIFIFLPFSSKSYFGYLAAISCAAAVISIITDLKSAISNTK